VLGDAFGEVVGRADAGKPGADDQHIEMFGGHESG
jgi:hypothetical protein